MNGEMGVIVHHDAERDRVLLACDDGRRLTLAVGELDTCASPTRSRSTRRRARRRRRSSSSCTAATT